MSMTNQDLHESIRRRLDDLGLPETLLGAPDCMKGASWRVLYAIDDTLMIIQDRVAKQRLAITAKGDLMKSTSALVAENEARAIALTRAAMAKPVICSVCDTELTPQTLDLDDDERCRHCATDYREGLIDDATEREAEAQADRQQVREERGDS